MGKDDFYEVEGIVEKRYNKRERQHEYLIKWKDYSPSHNSWVLRSDLHCQDLLREFEKRHKKVRVKEQPKSRQPKPKTSRKVKDSPERPRLSSSPSQSPKRSPGIPRLQSPQKSGEERKNDDYKHLLSLPIGSWESKLVSVDHVSEPEDNDLVIHVKMKSGKEEKYPGRVIRWLAPLKLIDYYERHLTFKESQ